MMDWEFDVIALYGLMLVGVAINAGLQDCHAREGKKRWFKGTIDNCEVVRENGYMPGVCSDCPDTYSETVSVRCGDETHIFEDYNANGELDRVRLFKKGKLVYSNQRYVNEKLLYQGIYDKWQKKIDDH